MSHELYEILGVSKSASQEEGKKAYRDAVMKWHPDRNALFQRNPKIAALCTAVENRPAYKKVIADHA